MKRINLHMLKICIMVLLGAVILICVIFIGIGLRQSYSNKKHLEKLKELRDTAKYEEPLKQQELQDQAETKEDTAQEASEYKAGYEDEMKLPEDRITENNNINQETDGAESELTLKMQPEYAVLYEMNNELAGWLTIEGTVINYPVMRGEDDEYYLKHDFEGNYSRQGSLFVKSFVDTGTPGTNFIIYGHNMKDGSMFGQLKEYKDKDFYSKHPYIIFHSLYEQRSYEIIAVFLSQVYSVKYEGFKYYEFYEAATEEEFIYFLNNIKAISLYDTEVKAEYGDRFITLSTCEYHVEDGRLVIVAKELN